MFGLDVFTVIGTILAIASQCVLLCMICRDGIRPVFGYVFLWPWYGIYLISNNPWRYRYPLGLLLVGGALDLISLVQVGGLSPD